MKMNTINLYEKKYSREELKKNIYALDLMDILKTQIVDVTFAVRYLMNRNYDLCDKYDITPEVILKYQPHIKQHELLTEFFKYDPDNDSVEDFETVSNK